VQIDFHCIVDGSAGNPKSFNNLQKPGMPRPTRIHLMEGNLQLSKAKNGQN